MHGRIKLTLVYLQWFKYISSMLQVNNTVSCEPLVFKLYAEAKMLTDVMSIHVEIKCHMYR